MGQDLLKRILKGSAPREVWITHGIPAVLVETVAEHIFKGVIIAARLTRALDADLGLVVEHLIEAETSRGGILEFKISKLASLLATAVQARMYLRMGFDVKDVLEKSLFEALEIVEELPQRKDVVKLVDDLLKE